MCHTSVLAWAPTVLPAAVVAGRRVLEVGSYDVNGSVRPIVVAGGPASYLGVDAQLGPGVDRVVDCARLVDELGEQFDIVISTEMLEHVVDWSTSIAQLVEAVAPGGLLVLTTRGPGFPHHPFPIDTWRYTVDGMAAILAACGLVDVLAVADPQAPGVFATAHKPVDWRAPWSSPSAARGVLPSSGVTAMVGP